MKGSKINSYFEITPIKKQQSFKQIEKRVFNHLYQKYLITKLFYEKLIAHNIIFNQKTHIVAKFKDYLILDDLSEFIKRYYTKDESLARLPGYLEYYYKYSYIFPNYTALIESRFIYKNIHRKQKIIDFQQEEEFKMRQREFEEIHLKHQRKKNKQQINFIFNNDVYNSIIKQSNDLYTLLFGSERNKNANSGNKEGQKSFSSIDIKNIINSIEKYDFDFKIGYNYNQNINFKKDKKKENNSSLMTKQSTFNSSIIYKKIKNLNKFHSKNDENLIGLKKMKNESFNISNSLLISSMLNKNTLLNKLLRSLKPTQNYFSNENSKSTSKYKDFKKINKIKVNQKALINEKKNYLTERTSIHKKQKSLQFELNYKPENIVINKSTKFSKKMKAKDKNSKKKLSDFRFYSKLENNSKAPMHKRINTISQMTESNYKSYKMKLLNKAKAPNYIEYNNKIKLHLKEMRELINNNKVKDKDKHYSTERGSLILTHRNTKKENPNKINDGIKKSINSNLKNNLKDSFIPSHLRKENLKLKYNQIMTLCNNKKTHQYIKRNENKIFYTEGSSMLLPLKEKIQEKLKRKAEKIKHLNELNDFSVLKNIKIKHFNTAKNSQSKDKPKKIINYTNKNNDRNNDQNKKIFNGNNKYRQLKRKEISPINIISNNTEKFGKNLIAKMMLKKNE